MTSNQYESYYYTERQAAVIVTTFSIVSITCTLVIIEEVRLAHMFVPFYLTVLIAGFVAALIMPRIPPLSRKEDAYINGAVGKKDDTKPEGYTTFVYGYKKALDRGNQDTNDGNYCKEGGQSVLYMWLGVVTVVMTF